MTSLKKKKKLSKMLHNNFSLSRSITQASIAEVVFIYVQGSRKKSNRLNCIFYFFFRLLSCFFFAIHPLTRLILIGPVEYVVPLFDGVFLPSFVFVLFLVSLLSSPKIFARQVGQVAFIFSQLSTQSV